MKINLDTFQILQNYVLIKPDKDLESYQIKGRETGLIAPSFKYEGTGDNEKRVSVKERNVAVTGTVYAVPQKLIFNLGEIQALKNRYTTHKVVNGKLMLVNFPVQLQIDHLNKSSVQFNTEIEVKVGDKVQFDYMAHKQCVEEGRILDTEHGEMYLMKYDMLYMTVGEKNEPIKMLNGYLIVEPEEIETLKEGAQEFIQAEGGLVLLAPKAKAKKSKKSQIGTVKHIGNINKGYLQEPDKSDFRQHLKPGEKILYDPRFSKRLEYETHQIYSEKVLSLIQRKDIILVGGEGIDLSTIELGRIRRRKSA